MYEFYYDFLKEKYGNKCKFICRDTNSFMLQIESEDFYEDFNVESDHYDFSNYPTDHPLYSETNKKVIGKFKDELGGDPIKQVIALR